MNYQKSKLTLKPYTRAEVQELRAILELPHGQKFKSINAFSKAFDRSPGAVQQKLWGLSKLKKENKISKTPAVINPINPNKEISIDIKAFRIENGKLFISI